MKLKQIALAAAMVASGSVLADVKFNGVIDANINNIKNVSTSIGTASGNNVVTSQSKTVTSESQSGIDSNFLETSHIGFKGTEDLGRRTEG